MFVFDETKALAASQRYALDVDAGDYREAAKRARDVAGFWRVLNSVPAREKLAVQVMPEQGKARG